jgi:hypothetical protein
VLNFKDIPQQGGGWFKPAEHKDAAAILIEVTAFDRQRPTPNGPKDSALCDLSIFPTEAELASGEPLVIKGTRVEQTVLARDLADLVGSATIVTVVQVPSKKAGAHPAWVWRPTSLDVKNQVIAYAQKREAEVQAALDAVPSFD